MVRAVQQRGKALWYMRPKRCAPVAALLCFGYLVVCNFFNSPLCASRYSSYAFECDHTQFMSVDGIVLLYDRSIERLARVWSSDCFSIPSLSSIKADVTDSVPLHSCKGIILGSRSAPEQHYLTSRYIYFKSSIVSKSALCTSY
jgi:hypothetical protein